MKVVILCGGMRTRLKTKQNINPTYGRNCWETNYYGKARTEILYVSDIVITGFSATALDAMILDKPVIRVNLLDWRIRSLMRKAVQP